MRAGGIERREFKAEVSSRRVGRGFRTWRVEDRRRAAAREGRTIRRRADTALQEAGHSGLRFVSLGRWWPSFIVYLCAGRLSDRWPSLFLCRGSGGRVRVKIGKSWC